MRWLVMDIGPAPHRARIAGAGRHLPSTRLSTTELMASTRHRTGIELERLTGIRERRISVGDEDSHTLAIAAARDCLRRSERPASALDVVINCSITKVGGGRTLWLEPTMSLAVARAIGAHRAVTFDLSNACAGMLSGVTVLNNWIRQGSVERGLVVSGEYISPVGGNATRHVRSVLSRELASLTLGDAGAALLVERAPALRPVSPYARRLAAELGVDLDPLTRKGGGPITAAEVRAAAGPTEPVAQPEPEPEPVRRAAGTDMRTAIAELMTKANREIPHYHLAATVDLHDALAWLHDHNQTVPVSERLLPAALLLKATALAAVAVPELNGHWVDGEFRPSSTVDLGVAVSLRGGGLLVPVLPAAETMPLAELMTGLREKAARARSGRPRASDLAPASVTVTNLGDLGVDLVHGVIHPPQVALVGFGAVLDRPWTVDGLLGVRPVITVTLAADHRATDGAVGARFLHAIDRILHTPKELS